MSLRLIGANPGLTLFADKAAVVEAHASTDSERVAFASVWRVDWSERGPGHALVVWHAGRTRVVAPDPALGAWLAEEFVRHFPEIEGLEWAEPAITIAPVRWELNLATGFRAEAADIVVTIGGPMDYRMITVDDFPLGGSSHQLSTVYVPCRTGGITIAGEPIAGQPQVTTEPRPSSTAFLAEAEVWSRGDER